MIIISDDEVEVADEVVVKDEVTLKHEVYDEESDDSFNYPTGYEES